MTCEDILRKHSAWSLDLEIDLLREFVEKRAVAPAQQATNSARDEIFQALQNYRLEEARGAEVVSIRSLIHWLEKLSPIA